MKKGVVFGLFLNFLWLFWTTTSQLSKPLGRPVCKTTFWFDFNIRTKNKCLSLSLSLSHPLISIFLSVGVWWNIFKIFYCSKIISLHIVFHNGFENKLFQFHLFWEIWWVERNMKQKKLNVFKVKNQTPLRMGIVFL